MSSTTQHHGSTLDPPGRQRWPSHHRNHHDRCPERLPRRIGIWFYLLLGRWYLSGPTGRQGCSANQSAHPDSTVHLEPGPRLGTGPSRYEDRMTTAGATR